MEIGPQIWYTFVVGNYAIEGGNVADLVFFNNVILLVGLVVALAMNLFGIRKKTFAATAIGLFVFTATLTYGLLLGATLYEGGTVCVLFVISSLAAAKE